MTPSPSLVPDVSLHPTEPLYILHFPGGTTTMGFSRCLDLSIQLSRWLAHQLDLYGLSREIPNLPPDSALIHAQGTLEGYSLYSSLLDRASSLRASRNPRLQCPIQLTPQLIPHEGHWVEVLDSHDDRRSFFVAKSSGWMPCHLELPSPRAYSGPAAMGAPYKSITRLTRKPK